MQETRVHSLGWEDLLEKGMATHFSILSWRIPWAEEPRELYSPWGCKGSDMTERLTYTHKNFLNLKMRVRVIYFFILHK